MRKAEHSVVLPNSSHSMTFKPIVQPTNEVSYVPTDVEVRFPQHDDLDIDRLHLLAYIPWDDKYLLYIPVAYRDFFKFVLPHLHPRTTNVHTALSMSFLPELVETAGKSVDERLLYIAVAIHDCGWSKVSHHDIANSLDYSGIAYTPGAAEAKAKHAIYGGAHAFQLLNEYIFGPPLSLEEKIFVSDIVRFHEKPHHYGAAKEQPTELILACEADRLWPFTHENFWLDTIRKGVEPTKYVQNVANAIDEMFLTEPGKKVARRLLAERRAWVAAYSRQLNRVTISA